MLAPGEKPLVCAHHRCACGWGAGSAPHSSREEVLLRENAELRSALEAERSLLRSVEEHTRLLNEVTCFCPCLRQCSVSYVSDMLYQ